MGAIERLQIDTNAYQPSSPQTATQSQTCQSFGFKWARRDSYESPAVNEKTRKWLLDRYCAGDASLPSKWLEGSRKLILDAGCGSGFSALLLFGDLINAHDYLGVDISDATEVAKVRFAERNLQADFLQCDLMNLPIPDGSVDLIFSEGVLHHTDNPEQAVHSLACKMKPGGRFLFYVYAKKAVIREYTDDYVRHQLQFMTNEEAWEALKPLTQLGIALGKLNASITIPQGIPFLGIKEGNYDLQRFFYWNICKMFYRPDWTMEEMNHINFDWFRPLNCHRQTPEDVARWVAESGLLLERIATEEAGITVVARKQD